MNVTRRSFSFGLGSLFGLFSLSGGAKIAAATSALGQQDPGTVWASLRTIQGRLCGTPALNNREWPDKSISHRLLMPLYVEGCEDPVPVVAWGDTAMQLYGAFCKGYLYPGQLLSITGYGRSDSPRINLKEIEPLEGRERWPRQSPR